MTEFNKTFEQPYFYNEQFRKYITQFMTVFSGFKVASGKNDFNSETNFIHVPIIYGGMDRVTAHIKSEHTQNKLLRLPLFSAKFLNVDLAPDRYKGVGQETRSTVLPRGGSIPDDLKVVYKYMPIPYTMRMELAIYTSNKNQHLELLEQILVLFDPDLQIQTSDKFNDWTQITQLSLDNIILDENYPSGTDQRMMISTLAFNMIIYLSVPANIKENFIKSIRLRLDAIKLTDDTFDVAKDVSRIDPPYQKLFDIDDFDIPTQ